MKKIIGALFVLILVLASISCQAQVTPTPTPAPTPTPTPTPTPAPAPAPTTASKVIELKFADFLPPTAVPYKDTAVPWAKKIESLTNGRVKFTFFPAESLTKTADMYDSVRSGMADIVHMDIGATPGVFPLSDGLNLPLIFDTDEASSATYMELIGKYLQDAEFKNVKVLWTAQIAPTQLQTNKKQIKTLEDFKGMKLTCTSQISVRALELLGATPVVVPIVETYTALERGMVDGVAQNWLTARTWKLVEVTKYRTTCSLWTYTTLVAMNLNSWNSLPSDIKGIFQQNLGVEFSRTAGAVFDAAEKGIVETLIVPYDKDKGNPEIYYLPEAEKAKWVQALQPLQEQWIAEKEAKGLPARAFVNDMLALAKKYKK
jgi:TRAP-type C4-dicarboxylate transport system substrate-binding protein